MKELFQTKLQEHYHRISAEYPRSQIFAILLCGSQNYNLDTELSDVDTKTIIIPTFESLINLEKPVSKVIEFPDGGSTTIQDIRLYIKNLRKQNINYVETLFTEYAYVNEDYWDTWNELKMFNERIASMNPRKALYTVIGMASSAYADVIQASENEIPPIRWYKKLALLKRLSCFIHSYISGESYTACLTSAADESIKNIKLGKEHDIQALKNDAYDTYDLILKFKTYIDKEYPEEKEDSASVEVLNMVLYDTIKKLMQEEI